MQQSYWNKHWQVVLGIGIVLLVEIGMGGRFSLAQ